MTAERVVCIRNGLVASASEVLPADIWVEDGVVRSIEAPGALHPSRAAIDIDATGCLVTPGGVDPHCHVGFTSGVFTTRDGYADVTRAALWGGTTTIVDFAIPRVGESPLEAARRQQSKANEGFCDSALHACVVEWDNSVPAQIRELSHMGIRTVKMFTTYRDETMASPETIRRVMEELRPIGGLAFVHCEDNDVIETHQIRCAEAGNIAARYHAATRPALAEETAVREVIAMAEKVRVPVYLVHQSTRGCLELAAAARRRGVRVWSEVVTHHLILDDSLYAGPHPEWFVCCPPLRARVEVEELSRGLWDGTISTVGSDHCGYDSVQKGSQREDVRLMPNGLPGVELRMPLIFSEFVARRKLPVERFVALCCANPAKANGLWPKKGALQPGSDADVVVWNPEEERIVSSGTLHMKTDYSPYEGLELSGRPVTVLAKGRVVVAHGQWVAEEPFGTTAQSSPIAAAML